MILVTVGTQNPGFTRLVRLMDKLAGELEDQVLIQYGTSCYLPQFTSSFPFTSSDEMERLFSLARIIVTHAEIAAITQILKMGKPLIVVPRLKAYHEAYDDHQEKLARLLAETSKIVVLIEPTRNSLLDAIEKAAALRVPDADTVNLVEALQGQVDEFSRQ
jgi:UDP-N-acetylglucosamine transferase subunit ALG13